MCPIDYKRYPPTWKTEIVPSVLKRANNCCENCGLKNGQRVYSIKLCVKDSEGRYKQRSVWFTNFSDIKRESQGEKIVISVKVVLTIAHLDHDEENWNVSLDRLMAMCQMCHLRYDAKEKYLRLLKKWGK